MLSLWLGVTITLSIEVCELIINLITAVYKAKRSQQPAAGETIADSKP